MTPGTLVTFGYTGLRGPADLRDLLRDHGVSVVVDVRLRPWSTNRAFSVATRRTVEEADFEYVHARGLGNVAYRTGGIEIADLDAIEDVLAILRAGRGAALMCACSDPTECHRSVLAEEAARRLSGLRVVHLFSGPPGRCDERLPARRRGVGSGAPFRARRVRWTVR